MQLLTNRHGLQGTVPKNIPAEISVPIISPYRDKMPRYGCFIEQRGNHTHREPLHILADPEYYQDHKPVFEQEEAVGHAVRAGYFYSAITDVAALSGDERYRQTTDRIWKDVVGTKLYLTGGIGSRKEVEGFGSPYYLPNKTAYCETCAAIAIIFWNYRLFFTAIQNILTCLNAPCTMVFSGIALAAKNFIPIAESDGEYFVYNSTVRQPWFNCSCCPQA